MINHFKNKSSKEYEIKKIVVDLENGIKDVFTSNNFKEYLKTMSKFHNYSAYNTLLIHLQNKDSTYVAGYTKWLELGRYVKKGSKAIKILAPVPHTQYVEQPKIDPLTNKPIKLNGEIVQEKVLKSWLSYKIVHVFDISQTEGKDLPTIAKELEGRIDNFKLLKNSIINISHVPIEFNKIEGTSKGYYDTNNKLIKIKENMSEKQTIKTMIHELAHSKLHDNNINRNAAEVEAESIAYVVSNHFNIDTSFYSFEYIASWSKNKELKELKSSLNTIIKTSNEIISSIEKDLQKSLKPKTLKEILNEAKEKSNINIKSTNKNNEIERSI